MYLYAIFRTQGLGVFEESLRSFKTQARTDSLIHLRLEINASSQTFFKSSLQDFEQQMLKSIRY